MTYPPQPPQQPSWGQQPDPYGQGQQPGSYPQSGGFPQQPQTGPQTGPQPTSSYQGFGTFGGGDGPQPPKRSTSTIVAIVVGALIVLGGGGAAVYFLTKGDDKGGGTADGKSTTQTTTSAAPTTTTSDTYDDSTTTDSPTDSTIASDGTSPESVRTDYIVAYEQKSFASVVTNACSDYKKRYGTDTSKIEQEISQFTITGTPVGAPEVTGQTAMAKIKLDFSKGGSSQSRSIKVKAVLEGGSWKFCGEAAG